MAQATIGDDRDVLTAAIKDRRRQIWRRVRPPPRRPSGCGTTVRTAWNDAAEDYSSPSAPHQAVVTVIEGTMTRREQGTQTVYRTGESWLEPGVVHQAGNETGAAASVVVTFLVSGGAPVTTVGTPLPGLPATGAGGAGRFPALAVAVAAIGLGAGLALRRRTGRA